MDLREAIRTVIREVAEEELRRIVREVLVEELVAENPRRTAAKKAAATRATNKATESQARRDSKATPNRAKKLGVFLLQQYKGKKAYPKLRDRTIEVVRLDELYVYPRILSSAGKNAKAKRMSYEHLLGRYDRVN